MREVDRIIRDLAENVGKIIGSVRDDERDFFVKIFHDRPALVFKDVNIPEIDHKKNGAFYFIHVQVSQFTALKIFGTRS